MYEKPTFCCYHVKRVWLRKSSIIISAKTRVDDVCVAVTLTKYCFVVQVFQPMNIKDAPRMYYR